MMLRCKIDDKIFQTPEELMRHMLEDHAEKVEDVKEWDIKTKILQAFPRAKILITQKIEGVYEIRMNWEDYKASFLAYIGYHTSYMRFSNHFTTVDKFIDHYRSFEKETIMCIQEIHKRYGDAKIYVDRMFEDLYQSSKKRIQFAIVKKEKIYFETYESGKLDDFLHKIHHYMVDEAEGTVEQSIEKGETVYYVDDTSVSQLLGRAKRAKVVILEEK